MKNGGMNVTKKLYMHRIIPVLLLTINLIYCLTTPVSAQQIKPATTSNCRQTLYRYTNEKEEMINDEHQLYNSERLVIERKVWLCDGVNGCGYYVRKNEYDSKKNLIKSISRNHKGKIVSEFFCTYNANNQPVKVVNNSDDDWYELNYEYNESNQRIRFVQLYRTPAMEIKKYEETLYEYHPNGKVKKETELNMEQPEGPHRYTYYNDKGLRDSIDSRGLDNKYFYNAQGQVILETSFEDDNGQTEETRYEYNDINLLVKKTSKDYGPLLKQVLYSTYKYDKKNRLIKESHRRKGSNDVTEIVRLYDGDNYRESTYEGRNLLLKFEENEIKDGLLRKKRLYGRSYLKSYQVFTYDVLRNLIKTETFKPDGSLLSRIEWAYECD